MNLEKAVKILNQILRKKKPKTFSSSWIFKNALPVYTFKVTIRLAKDVKALEQRWYIDYQTRIQEMGKMLGGWISSTRKTSR